MPARMSGGIGWYVGVNDARRIAPERVPVTEIPTLVGAVTDKFKGASPLGGPIDRYSPDGVRKAAASPSDRTITSSSGATAIELAPNGVKRRVHVRPPSVLRITFGESATGAASRTSPAPTAIARSPTRCVAPDIAAKLAPPSLLTTGRPPATPNSCVWRTGLASSFATSTVSVAGVRRVQLAPPSLVSYTACSLVLATSSRIRA